MLDEGDNEITIHLPESVKRLNEEAALHPVAVDADSTRKLNPIRDYSMDTFNGKTGMPYWGYNEANLTDTR